MIGPRSRVETFVTLLFGSPSISNSALVNPTRTTPSMIAIVAGTAPPSRTFCSISRATVTFRGLGKP